MDNCSIIPQVKNKEGKSVDSKLFTDLLALSENREEAKTRYLQTRTSEFKTWFGDWEKFPEQSSKVVDENGEPLLVYHGTGNTFDTFDKSKRGNTTGKSTTGEFDSENAFFFSDNQNVSFVYSIFARQEELKGLSYALRRITSTLSWEAKNKTEIYNNARKDFPKFAQYVDSLKSKGMNNEQIMEQLKKQRTKYEELSRKYSNGGAISNSKRYYRDATKSVDRLVNEKEQILKGNYSSISPFGNDYSFSLTRGGYDSMYIESSGLIYGGYKDVPSTERFNHKNIKDLSSSDFDSLVNIFREAISKGQNKIQDEIKEGGFTPNLMPTYLNARNIIEKDFEGKSFVDQINSEGGRKVASELVLKAIKEGNDGVVLRNIADPEVGNTYAVFEPNQIKSISNTGSFSKDNDNIHLQQNSEFKKSSKELDDKVRGFLKQIGVDVKSVKQITDEDGNKLDANAVANLLTKTIEVVEGSAKLDTLPHEAAHFLLEILKQNNSPLYNSMLSEIGSYDIYKQTIQEYGEVYKGNEAKIKDEAIARVIGAQIANQFEQDTKKSRVATWFNRVLSFIKEKLGLIDRRELDDAIIKDNPFGEAASLIYNKNTTNFKFEDYTYDSPETKKYFQLAQPKQLEDRIRDKFNVSGGENGGRYTRLVDGKSVEIKNRLSDSKTADVRVKSDKEKSKEEAVKVTGLKGHQDLNNIIDRVVAERDGKLSPPRLVKTDEETYNTLERYVRQMMENVPADSRIVTNTPIYDAKRDLATTPSMMIINQDGKFDLYNWLFTTTKKDGNVNEISKLNATKTLQEQKKILAENYGVTKFGKVRTIPIETKFTDGFLTSIRTGSQTFDTSVELNPIPVSEETTGNEKLDRVLGTLLVKKNNLEKSQLPFNSSVKEKSDFNERKYAQLQKIDKAIRDIQLKQDVKEFVNIGLSTIQELADTPINQYSEERLQELQNTVSFYGKDMLSLIADQVKDFSETDKGELGRLVTESQLYFSNIQTAVAEKLISSTGRTDLNDAQPDGGVYKRMFRSVSQQANPVIKAFWKLVQGAKAKTRESVLDLNKRIGEAVENLRKAQPGIASGDLFNFMLKKREDGGHDIVAKYDSKFFSKLQEARANKNTNFIKQHTTFDTEAYNKAFAEKQESLQYVYRNDVDKEEKISDRIKSFRNLFSDNENGLSNPKNPYVSINEDRNLWSKEFQNIQAKPELKAFYDLYMKESKQFQKYIGKDLGGRFVWNVHNTFIDGLRENGFGAFKNMSSILDQLEAKSGETLGMIDPETGKPLYEIPAYYTDSFDVKNQSKDLGKVLSLVGAMAYNHAHMRDIEATSKLLEMTLSNQPEIQTDSNGNPIKNKLTNAVAKAVGSSNTLDQYRDYMNYYLYGIKNKTKDYVVKLGSRNISTLATIRALQSWFVGKSLSFNPQSIIAHAMRGETNGAIVASMKSFFSSGQYHNAIAQVSKANVARDGKFFSLLGYFDLMDGENFHKKAESLSAFKLGQHLTYDHMFIGHRATDYTIRNAILGAMLQSHTFQDGKIVKIGEANKDAKSLHDLIEIKNDKLDFGNIPKEALEGFRNKVQKVGDMVFGMNTRDDISLAHLNVLTRAMMSFRNWIPGMVGTRYQALNYSEDLGEYELGRYRSFWNNIVNKQIIPLLLDNIKAVGVFGYGGKFGDVTINKAKSLYADYMEKNPEAKITESQYVDLHLANVRAGLTEAYITLAMLGAAWVGKKEFGDTPQQHSVRKFITRQLNRNLADISFFYNPMEFNSIIKSPIPLTQAYLEPLHLIQTFWHEGETVAGIPHKEKKGEVRKAIFKAIPGLNGFESLLSFTQDDYDKTKTVGTDSGSR